MYSIITKIYNLTPSFIKRAYYKVSGSFSLAEHLFPNRSQVVSIQSGIIKGMKMNLNLRKERNYYMGSHEPETQEALKNIVGKDMVAYNLGAHIGFYALCLCKLVGRGGRVIAFEPAPDVYDRLLENVALNDLPMCSCEASAVGEYDEEVIFNLSLSDTQGRFSDLPHVKPQDEITVQCVSIDSYISKGGPVPDVIFMDIEHAEGRALKGMRRLLAEHAPLLFIEMHGRDAIEEAFSELQRSGYALYAIPGFAVATDAASIDYGQYFAAPASYEPEQLFLV